MSKKARLKEYIVQAKTRQVITELLSLTEGDRDLHETAIALSARYQKYLKEKHGNTADLSHLDIELNRIHAAALDLIERLPDENSKKLLWWKDWRKLAAAITSLWWKEWKDWRKLTAAIVSIIVFGAVVAKFSGNSLRDLFAQNQPVVASDTTHATQPPVDPPKDNLLPAPKKPVSVQPSNKTQGKPAIQTNAPLPDTTALTITCKTNKGTQDVRFAKGETARLFFKVTQPCYVRTFYRLANGDIITFYDDPQVQANEVGRFLEIGAGFEVGEPWGEEKLYVFAQSTPFPPIKTVPAPYDADYMIVTEGLPEALQKTRGLKAKRRFAEATLTIHTTEQ